MQDVDPGIDHCNSDENVPYELKKMVVYRSQQPPGTIIIDTQERHLYATALASAERGFTWQGLLQISRKAEWPDWRPHLR